MPSAPAEEIPLYRVLMADPVSYIPTGRTTGVKLGTPAPGSFDPASLRIVPVAKIRAGDVLLGVCQYRHDRRTCEPLKNRAQYVWYFTGTATPQEHDARPFDAGHCDLCLANEFYGCIGPDDGYTVLDGCTPYPPGSLLLAVPRDLAS